MILISVLKLDDPRKLFMRGAQLVLALLIVFQLMMCFTTRPAHFNCIVGISLQARLFFNPSHCINVFQRAIKLIEERVWQ